MVVTKKALLPPCNNAKQERSHHDSLTSTNKNLVSHEDFKNNLKKKQFHVLMPNNPQAAYTGRSPLPAPQPGTLARPQHLINILKQNLSFSFFG